LSRHSRNPQYLATKTRGFGAQKQSRDLFQKENSDTHKWQKYGKENVNRMVWHALEKRRTSRGRHIALRTTPLLKR
jgi:hypothetical protein